MQDPNSKFRSVNRILGTQPSVGPIPGDQIIPWSILAFLGYVVGDTLLGLNWLQTCLLVVWLVGTWWILTGKQAWRFLSKFIPVPHVTRGYVRYMSLLERQTHEKQNRKKKSKGRRR